MTTMPRLLSTLTWGALASCVGCGESSPLERDASEEDATHREHDAGAVLEGQDGRCDARERLGGFEVALDDQFTNVSGQVERNVVQAVFLADVGVSEFCRLVRRTNPFCDPVCTSETLCSTDMECVPAPRSANLGSVSISGLEAEVSMSPVQPGNRYFFTQLPQPGMLPGKPITLSAQGGDLTGFRLHAQGVDVVDLREPEWTLERGKAIELSWTPRAAAAQTRVRATLNIDQHGATPVTLECDFPDQGAATIPAELVDGLLDAGISGFPNGNIYRETTAKVSLPEGCVDFVAFARTKLHVVSPGHVPCRTDAECVATGQTCDLATESCR